jgi:hypothetical protein
MPPWSTDVIFLASSHLYFDLIDPHCSTKATSISSSWTSALISDIALSRHYRCARSSISSLLARSWPTGRLDSRTHPTASSCLTAQ